MIHCIILAAGFGKRFSGDKLNYIIDGKQMYRHIVDKLINLRDNGTKIDITIVSREGQLKDCPLPIVNNTFAEEGISTSIRAGLNAISKDDGPVAFFVADQPYLKQESIEVFFREFESGTAQIMCAAHDDILGNPVIFARKYEEELKKLQGDCGGKKVVLKHFEECRKFEIADIRELSDVDFKP